MRKTLSVSVVLVALTALAPLMTTIQSSAAEMTSCHDEAPIVLKDIVVHTPSVFGSGKGTVSPFQFKIPLSLYPACQTGPVQCEDFTACYVHGYVVAESSSGGAGASVQLQYIIRYPFGVSAWTNLGSPASCRQEGANKYCAAGTNNFLALPNGGTYRALCTWKSKALTVDRNAKIKCEAQVFHTS